MRRLRQRAKDNVGRKEEMEDSGEKGETLAFIPLLP
jgi:hypothetical protein